ncbi:Ldh family oxidoreductase [Leisingera aquaemixtae]|jgi:(2R)-3-sulfolactate dehydrogenase (NADP+)|uniref:Ldh family oxidoreductase n=1 Tax=Leisingera aquaemixtae TaxID=1396826 RepID=A0ABY5WLM8_9RHOB|nr:MULTISPECIES: Ldh family oxidoreductase [Leisingera]QDI76595.1 Ldh family oxidoreductase [Leisingera aquaemixtae]UWQ38234.1 Ldh family oxidoreductase [Leisingera aquaemixtae]UWQ42350.1 Ldh family oxidoreductase [Leisingera aquaemixtae]
MTETRTLTLAEIEDLSFRALVAAGTSEANARPLAVATAATEADGVASHGLAYIPIYAEHVQCGKVDGQAVPVLSRPRPGVVAVDAATGFAHPAIDAGFEALIPAAREQGIAVLAIRNSYNCGVLGYHTARLARAGLVGLGFTNAPASIAPSGGRKPVVGTNPFSVAVPGEDGEPELLIDQSASTIAKSEVMKHAREGKEIPLGWALDADGNPTTDPDAGLKGSMAPSGGYKGVGVALLTEIMAAALTGATLGINASPFSGTAGGPPKTGQMFIAIDPAATSNDTFRAGMVGIVGAVRAQPGAHLPGDGRRGKRIKARDQGVAVSVATLDRIKALLG